MPTKPRTATLTPQQFKDIRQAMKKTQPALAADLDVDVRTIQRLEAGDTPIGRATARQVLALLKAHTGDVPKRRRKR